ncbi:hypothetical protein KY342_01470 [Candidatus Woesearchaeota archaeon]|nr:hypothetical protein [Candidatus Woesearchaeota archaeon]
MIKNNSNEKKVETISLVIMLSICIILLTALYIFDMPYFTGFVIGGENFNDNILTNLVIIDDADTEIKSFNEEVKFYARYVDINTGNAIEDALCTIYFDDNSSAMQFNVLSQLYEYTKIFSSVGLYNWNVTCSRADLTPLTEKDIVIIGSISSTYREEIFTTVCVEEWECTDWGICLLNGVQYRECFDLNRCDDLYDKKMILHIERSSKPFHIRSCFYQPTCEDMIINNDESDVDCGGPCPKCEDGKVCRTDDDCINKCDLAIRRCYTPEEVVPEVVKPVVEIPYKPKLIPALMIIFVILILIIVILTTYKYGLIHKGVEYYRERRGVVGIRREAKEAEKERRIKEAEEKPEKKIKKIEIEKESDKLQNVVDYFEKELKENVDYLKKKVPKRLVVSSELDKLVEKRKMILQEIKKTEEELDSLQKLRFELERKEIGIDARKTIDELKRAEDRIKDKLNQIKRK